MDMAARCDGGKEQLLGQWGLADMPTAPSEPRGVLDVQVEIVEMLNTLMPHNGMGFGVAEGGGATWPGLVLLVAGAALVVGAVEVAGECVAVPFLQRDRIGGLPGLVPQRGEGGEFPDQPRMLRPAGWGVVDGVPGVLRVEPCDEGGEPGPGVGEEVGVGDGGDVPDPGRDFTGGQDLGGGFAAAGKEREVDQRGEHPFGQVGKRLKWGHSKAAF